MSKLSTGLPLKLYKGKSHKQGGINVNALGNKVKGNVNAVAEVEGGEYNYRYNPNNPKDNYILSKELGIAAIAKKASSFDKLDRISANTRNNLLNKSLKLNEVLKAQQEQQQPQMQLGGLLKKYSNGDNINGQNNPNRAVSTPDNELLVKPTLDVAPLATTPMPKSVSSVTPGVNNPIKSVDATKELQQATTPVKPSKDKNNLFDSLGKAASAVHPAGAAISLAPYAVDLGKAMFDKTSVQDLQKQGSAMRIPNTKYAKNGGKLDVTPLPKFILGGNNPLVIQQSSGLTDFAGQTNYNFIGDENKDILERTKEYDSRIGIPNALKSFYPNQGLTAYENNKKVIPGLAETPSKKSKFDDFLKSGLLLKGTALAGSLASALQSAQKETLRLPDFGRADEAMSRATAFSINPALNEIEQSRGKSQEAIRSMATTAGQLTSNLQSVNQRAGQQSAGLRVQEQQMMNQLAAQRANYETSKASAIQQELARFDENTLMNKAATQEGRVAFIENINNLGAEIMKQGSEQDIANQQDRLAVQNAKLKLIEAAFTNPDIISSESLEKMLDIIEKKGNYADIAKLLGPSNSEIRQTLLKDEKSKKEKK